MNGDIQLQGKENLQGQSNPVYYVDNQGNGVVVVAKPATMTSSPGEPSLRLRGNTPEGHPEEIKMTTSCTMTATTPPDTEHKTQLYGQHNLPL